MKTGRKAKAQPKIRSSADPVTWGNHIGPAHFHMQDHIFTWRDVMAIFSCWGLVVMLMPEVHEGE